VAVRYALVAVVASLLTVFALQNHAAASIRFLIWRLEGVPLAGVILVSAAAGIVMVGVPLWLDRWRLRARARQLEARLAAVEAEAARARDAVPGSAAPPAAR
jgi:uncharacterized integral membrane protein